MKTLKTMFLTRGAPSRRRRAGLIAGAIAASAFVLAPAAPARAAEVAGRNDSLRDAFRDVAAKVAPHAVHIKSERGGSLGYGVAVKAEDGGVVVVTAMSCVRRSDRVRLVLQQGDDVYAKVAKRDEPRALALLVPERDSGLRPIALGSTDRLVAGSFLVSVGISDRPLAVGVVSALERRVKKAPKKPNLGLMGLFMSGNEGPKRNYDDVIQHDAPIDKKIFGSPVCNENGELVGINVANPYRGSSYAIPVSAIAGLVGGVEAPKPPERGFLGVSVEETDEGGRLVAKVVQVVEGGPAEKAGLQQGDIIVEVEGEKFEGLEHLGEAVGSLKPGDVLRVTIDRDGTQKKVEVTLGKRPD